MTQHGLIRSPAGAVTGFHRPILLATADHLPERAIALTLGLVRGNTVRARSVGRDILALMRNIVGGEVREYTKLLAESREQALDRMVEQALGLNADAVVGLRFSTSVVMGGAAELMAYGTAVRLAPAG